ncbi:hypothetical protein EV356DRAFT_454405 [Viridothelium virens]|uniref:Uncharacterized protein n=1 Tax=Viridothelium virens TaxID=1048519 RepID=A0A6A6GXH2_VIRVR|nr:hypothetical protein EV356DRAFT_454405 [Viridothelium virens]
MARIKHRYLLVSILYPQGSNAVKASTEKQNAIPESIKFREPTPDGLTLELIKPMIKRGVAELFGDYGVGMTLGSLKVIYFSPATSTIIIRVARAHYQLVWAALTYTTQLPRPVNQPCVFQVVRVSGTIRKAEEEVIRRAREEMRHAQKETGEDTNDVNLGVLGFKADPRTGRTRILDGVDEALEIEDDDADMVDEDDDEYGSDD